MKCLPLVLGCALFAGCGGAAGGSDESDTSASSGEVAPDTSAEPGDDAVDDVHLRCGDEVDGGPCDDGNACTTGDRCVSGVCVGATSVECEDEGECRVGVCDPETGCKTVALDGREPCGSLCVPGVCLAGACVVEPGSEVVCPAPENPCAVAVLCEPSTGLCTKEVLREEGAECDSDMNACSLERCDGAGACVATGETETCADEAAMDPCWTQVCEPTKGCRRGVLLTGLSCDDNNACTVGDQCIETVSGAGACVGEPLEVDDGNPCTDDYCEGGEVRHSPLSGVSCVPETECEVAGMCAGGSCVAVRACQCPGDPGCPVPVCDPPCANGACVADGVCDCGDTGYSGPTCATPVCDPPCANGACVATGTGNECSCEVGWTGVGCDVDVNDCAPNPCANGTCTDTGVMSYTCACEPGWTGPNCDQDVNDCAPNPCANGTCQDMGVLSYQCICDEGYEDDTCSTPVCDPPCANGACIAPDQCLCDEGYEDDTCSTPICDPPCENGACIAPDLCLCDDGYDGDFCSDPICDPDCVFGECVAPELCECDPGFVGPICDAPESVGWIRTFGSTGEDYGGMSRMLTRSHTGTFIAVGGTTSTDSDGDAYLIEVDDDGTLLATRTYGGTISDSFSAITRLGSGYVACGGSRSWGGNRNKGYCVTLGPDLTQTTTNTYGGNDLTNFFDVTAAGDHFISAGNTTDTDAWLDFVIRKHAATGTEVWKHYFGRSQDDTAYNVLAMSDGGFLLTGFTGGWAGCQQYYAIKTASDGTKAWDRTYGTCMNGAQGNWHQMRQAIETPDGGFVATGSILQSGQRSVFLQRFAANGDPVWLQTFGGNSTEYGSGVVATADGGFAVVGWTRSFGAGGDDVYLIKTDGDGVSQWQRTFGGPADDQGVSILALPDGGFLLGGSTRSWGAGAADLLLIRTDALGQAPDYIQCTPTCQNGGVCMANPPAGNTCDCTGTGYFGQSCQFDEDEYTTAWDKFTEPRVVAMNAQVTSGTISWKRLTTAALYRVTRYSGANYGRVLELDTTNTSFTGAVNQLYRIEALDAGGAVLDFVNVVVPNLYPSNWTTGTFVDDFNDNVIAPNYINNKPHQVVEANGYIQMTMTATDDYPGFYLPYDTEGRRYFRLTAKLFQYRSNSQYTGGIMCNAVENSWKHLAFGSPWEDYRAWRGGQLRSIRYRSNPPTDAVEQIVNLDNVSRFGSWFDYELIVDTVTGQATGKLGAETFPALFPVTTSFRPTGRILIYFSQYGWFTGHYLRVDDLRVEAYD